MAKRRKPKITVGRTQFHWAVFVGGQLHSEHADRPRALVTAKDLRRHG